jgi:hypothetical protein
MRMKNAFGSVQAESSERWLARWFHAYRKTVVFFLWGFWFLNPYRLFSICLYRFAGHA